MRNLLVVSLLLCCVSCGPTDPSDDLTGHWNAQSIGHSEFVTMTLQQSGDVITGTACGTSDGVLLYRDVRVTGDYPRLQFTVTANQTYPCCQNLVGTVFTGQQDSTKDIVGKYGTVDLRFKRSTAAVCPP